MAFTSHIDVSELFVYVSIWDTFHTGAANHICKMLTGNNTWHIMLIFGVWGIFVPQIIFTSLNTTLRVCCTYLTKWLTAVVPWVKALDHVVDHVVRHVQHAFNFIVHSVITLWTVALKARYRLSVQWMCVDSKVSRLSWFLWEWSVLLMYSLCFTAVYKVVIL